MPESYVLVAAVGLAPASLTEAAWSLRQEGFTPAVVHVLTTAQGWRQLETELFRGGVSSRWRRLCTEVLGRAGAVPVEVHVPDVDGEPLEDLRSRDDDLAFGEVAYALVRRLTDEADDLPVVGSIAGGRRTMGAHLMAAFSLCARPQDRLIHVLATPDPQPIAPAYWPGDGGEPLVLDRVDVPLPRVRAVLEAQFLERVGDRYDLPSLLDVLGGYNVSEVPVAVRVELSRGRPWRSPVTLLAADGEVLAEAAFTPRMVAVLLLLADEIEGARRTHGGAFGAVPQGVPEGKQDADAPLVASAHASARVNAVFDACGMTRQPAHRKPWATAEDVSRAVSRYHDRRDGLRSVDVPPLIQHHLRFDTQPGHRLAEAGGVLHDDVEHWHWATRRHLPITVVAPPGVDPDRMDWPFRHLRRPVRAADADRSGGRGR